MAAAIACRQREMPSDAAAAMLVDYYQRDPLEYTSIFCLASFVVVVVAVIIMVMIVLLLMLLSTIISVPSPDFSPSYGKKPLFVA